MPTVSLLISFAANTPVEALLIALDVIFQLSFGLPNTILGWQGNFFFLFILCHLLHLRILLALEFSRDFPVQSSCLSNI